MQRREDQVTGERGAYRDVGGFAIADFEDGPGLGYQETQLRGVPVNDPKDVIGLALAFDRLRAEALPRAASLALLEEALTTWSQAV